MTSQTLMQNRNKNVSNADYFDVIKLMSSIVYAIKLNK